MYWKKIEATQFNKLVEDKLQKNTRYANQNVFGVPGSWLNRKVFPSIDFLKEAPFLRTMVENPNHIGCHTSGDSESFFSGTQSIEKEVIRICAEEILNAKKDSYDGYIATGGTEGNIQALWAFRNYLMEKHQVSSKEVAVLFSEDTHYSVYKACNLLSLTGISVPVDKENRQIEAKILKDLILKAKNSGVKYFTAILSMGTTMFGSVDNLDNFLKALNEIKTDCMIHIDAAFGGFIYPFSGKNKLDFTCPKIFSASLDGHKMLQSPYGTGIFLIKRPLLDYVSTKKASYVQGHDQTLCGSRSGALAVAMLMIFSAYGSEGWKSFIDELLQKTNRLTSGLKKRNIPFFREEGMNIVTIPTGSISTDLLQEYHWVPDNNQTPSFFKAVIMDHIETYQIDQFLEKLI